MWKLDEKIFHSRFLLGTAAYPSLSSLMASIKNSAAEIITVSLQRQMPQERGGQKFWDFLLSTKLTILPNTAGCHHAEEAVLMAEMAREIFSTNWIKLEVIGDDYNLQPDPFELVKAAKILVAKGFTVFPYCTEDLVLCQRLVDVGCKILMPWASPIGSGRGLSNPYALTTLRQRLPEITLIIDAGIGKPSQATQVMEFGFDGVLLNTAVSQAKQPELMAKAFAEAISAGRMAYTAGIMPKKNLASPSTPLIDTPFWHQTVSEVNE